MQQKGLPLYIYGVFGWIMYTKHVLLVYNCAICQETFKGLASVCLYLYDLYIYGMFGWIMYTKHALLTYGWILFCILLFPYYLIFGSIYFYSFKCHIVIIWKEENHFFPLHDENGIFCYEIIDWDLVEQ